ncbi:MAG: GTP-binding protein, partial [Oscillospiraceae bacterium]|nr:GTP-binding protein [Oscillospiraceae bacterium]
MTKITIFSGFLGAGKTTLIKKLIADGYQGEKLVLIENEFGQIGIDGGFLQDAGVEITEMNSGCICCSLVGDFGKALRQVIDQYQPDRILIEPSGVGKLSDVIRAVQDLGMEDAVLDGFTTVVDAKKCKLYQKNFGEFFDNQITYASCIILSHTQGLSQEKLDDCVARLREKNPAAPIVTTDWDALTGAQITEAMTQKNTLDDELQALLAEAAEHDHHHHHHDHDEDEHHHHDHDEEEHHHHHHHDHDEEEHHHHHEHDEDEHHHHHDHDEEEHHHH